jgi:uncharacterized repeat protein (TIGR03833 family)
MKAFIPEGHVSGQNRQNIKVGAEVDIVLKKDQPTGKLTRGKVKDILTSDSFHHRGIKVRLEDGQVGRVQNILPQFPKINGIEYQEGLT